MNDECGTMDHIHHSTFHVPHSSSPSFRRSDGRHKDRDQLVGFLLQVGQLVRRDDVAFHQQFSQ
jgi:hypothetical protein